ncbi:heme-binding domain-containing protein [Geopsychrobacter electrodiphilus]|uniref:heme-binding domain-containing protein n=1 Tax=Geopsychrobacter electrodiphilus TaxID=225196 RepID=UPI000368560E|nr:heme-binding domain-containing protein [Geopsychrobacter electrodiphilus]
MKLKIFGIVILVLVAMQFIPYGKDHSNPAVVSEPQWNSNQTKALFLKACGDCHSHVTKWPKYSNYAPVSWLVQSDVEEGRQHFNVSNWGPQQRNKGDEAAGAVREGEMPPWYYLLPHPEARLTDAETQTLISGLVATFGDKEKK